MITLVKKIIKSCFRSIDIDIRRIPEYEKNRFIWLKDFPINTIIDIGANMGQFVLEMSRIFPDAKIYSFEPIKDVFTELSKRCANIKNFRAFNIAASNFNAKTTIHRSKISPSSSILEMGDLHIQAFPHTQETFDEEITLRKLDDVILEENLQLEPQILIKLDVQGYEDKVIQGGIQIFKKAKVIITEVSYYELYRGQVLFEEIYHQLTTIGFKYKGNINNSFHPKTGLPLFADAIFVC